MEWRPAGWSLCLPLLIFPCTIVQKFSSGTGSSRWSWKKGRKTVTMCVWDVIGNDVDDDDVIGQIMFKMDINGNGSLVERCHLNKAMGLHSDAYTFDKFRYACILSGCDYVASLPGIGLAKATKVFRLSRQTDIATVTWSISGVAASYLLIVRRLETVQVTPLRRSLASST